MSDEDILKSSYKKPSRFGELFDRHNKRFLKIAERALRSKDDAEDAVQEAFVKIYKYGKKFPSNGGKFAPWSNTILRNCIADQINKYKNSTVTINEEIENTALDLNQLESTLGDVGYVRFILKKIDSAAAEIINLRYILGKSFKEIAKILNIKNSTARVRVHRSKKIFARAYKQFDNQL
ncbi:MAG: sigma-70 family RNA polymerase sigma factor [Candidatus Zambryskibacteria bacterium]